MALAPVIPHPAVERMALRRQMVTAVEQLLDAVDVLVRELDTNTPDPDLEPSLGAPEHPHHLCAGGGWRMPDGIFEWSRGSADDREADGDRWNPCDTDMEPSLGSAPGINQLYWANGGRDDREQEHDGREPSLGSLAVEPWSNQRRWAKGGDQGERETVCEDEGAQCEDEGAQQDAEPEPSGAVPSYPNIHDQRRHGRM